MEGVRHEWVWHSPTGFEWGSEGSIPVDLALNILLAATDDRDFAASNHQAFKWRFVSATPGLPMSLLNHKAPQGSLYIFTIFQ